MKKVLSIVLVAVLALALVGCGAKPTEAPKAPAPEAPKYKDGTYYAEGQMSEKSGWKYVVLLDVKDGKIANVNWTGVSVNAGLDKDSLSRAGKYPIVENGGAKAPWHEQADLVEKHLISTQDPTKITYSSDAGNTQDIAGASIKVKEFFELAQSALAAGPVAKGPYKDGAYHAEEKEFSANSGFKYTVDLTVLNGNIAAVNWNAVHKDGGDDKKTLSKNGQYPMVENGGAKLPWHEQAAAVEAHLLKTQDPAKITYSSDAGNTQDIAGATLKVKPFFNLAGEALATAK